MKPISREIRASIVSLHKEGKPFVEIAELKGISKASVSRIIKEDGDDTNKCKRGRPRILTEQQNRYYRRLLLAGRLDTAAQVAHCVREDSNIKVSPSTVRKNLRRMGLVSTTKKKRPMLKRAWKKSDYNGPSQRPPGQSMIGSA